MPSIALALAAVVAITATSEGPPIRKDGSVVHGGVAFRLPAGLAHSTRDDAGVRTFAAVSREGDTGVAVQVLRVDRSGPCLETAPEGVDVETIRTAGGLRGCVVRASAPGNGLGVIHVLVSTGETIVSVNAVSRSAHTAFRLAREVADSVRIVGRPTGLIKLEFPRPDPRLIGCFVDDRNVHVGTSFGVFFATRCFEADFTFTEARRGAVSIDRDSGGPMYREHIGGAMLDDGIVRGHWIAEGDQLVLLYEDGTRADWRVYVTDENVLANGNLWARQ